MNKISFILVGLLVVGLGVWMVMKPSSLETDTSGIATTTITGASVVAPGSYTVDPAQSSFSWSGQKPLIEGYINSGSIALSEGSIVVEEAAATGSFILDMNTLEVGLTAKKPGQEGALEKQLKSDLFFGVAKYPTAAFAITKVEPTETSATDFVYTVTGTLTMKGTSGELTFPATIYFKDGALHASAETEFDRTKWGLTAGSGNFFENLGDNVISDMVALSFNIVALPESAENESAE